MNKKEKILKVPETQWNKIVKQRNKYKEAAIQLKEIAKAAKEDLELAYEKYVQTTEMLNAQFSNVTRLEQQIEELNNKNSCITNEKIQALEKRNYDLKMRLMCPAHLRIDDKTIPFLSTQIIFLGQELESLRDELKLPPKDVVRFGQELWKEKRGEL